MNKECLVFSYLSGTYQFINNSLIIIRFFKRIVWYSKKRSVIGSSFFIYKDVVRNPNLGYFDCSDLLRISSSDWTQVDRDHFWSINFHSQFHSLKIRFFKAKVSGGFFWPFLQFLSFSESKSYHSNSVIAFIVESTIM